MGAPRLETERLILRAITCDDRFAIFENYSDPNVAKWFFDQPYTQIEQADQVIHEFIKKTAEGTGLAWAILLKDSGEFLGTCSYESLDANRHGEIGFDLAKKHWGHGYMAEALGAIITHGFAILDLARIEAHTYSRNSRARRVLERVGFKVGSVTEDSHCYTLARPDGTRMRA
ncbi:MAG: GNAT family N-acetyltransferase [Candidatus Eisenbacteria bacterium]